MKEAVEAARRIVTPASYKDGVTYLYDRDIQLVARALLSAVEQKQWQPMASAPLSEDGKYPAYFIVWNGHHVGVAFRRVPYSDGDPEFCEEGGDFIEPPPTLWQPLPSPPTKQATHDR